MNTRERIQLKIKERKLFLVYILILFTSLLITQINLVSAADLTASQYNLKIILNYPQEIFSDSIEINRSYLESNNKTNNKNIYLDSFTLKNSKGKEIPSRYITLETPYLQKKGNLDRQHRFLILKTNQQKSWFRIGLLKETAFFEPGEYTGIININNLDWEIRVVLVIKPFVSFSIEDYAFKFKITEPFVNSFIITDSLFKMDIKSNHNNWEIKAHLEEFINKKGEKLDSKYLYYNLEKEGKIIDINKLKKNQFSNFTENEVIINGSDYEQGLRAIRFGIDLTRNNTDVQEAGLYRGKVIFTLRNFNNNL